MPSLIGTNPNQCPTNADLGTMAFQGKDSVKIDGGVTNNVAITGGSINNTPIGATTPSTGAFTTLSTTGNTTLGDSATDTVTIQAGSAANPSLTFAGDTNTGIYSSGADTIGISTAGVARLQIAADGGVGLGSAPVAGRRLNIAGAITGATTGYGQLISGTFQSDVTVTGVGITTFLQTQATAFTLSNIYHYFAQQGTIGAGSTLTGQNGFLAGASLIGATNNYGFRGQIPAGTGRWNLYMDGTAQNYINGILLIGSTSSSGEKLQVTGDTKLAGNLKVTGTTSLDGLLTASIGYAVGTGGAATQTTSRTTGVTLNKINGSITLVSAAGSTTWQSFTVTNSVVAATDIITVCQKSGTDLYQIHVTNVATGSFQITFATTGGTTTEQPVFNFVIIKGVNS